MSDDRKGDELGIGPGQQPMGGSDAGARQSAAQGADAAEPGAGSAADGMCQKADWLAPTTELPVAAPLPAAELPVAEAPTAELPVAVPPQPVESTRDRVRRWGREYGGYLAAAVLAAAVLVCAVAGLPAVDMTWHSATTTAHSPSAAAVSSPAPVPPSPTTSPATASPPPSRKPTRRPAAAPRRATASPARPPSPTPGPALLGPANRWALAGIVNDYCDREFDRDATLLRPWPDSGAEKNWACQRRRHDDVIVANMTDACQLRYGRGAVARYLDAKDPFSWRCYRG